MKNICFMQRLRGSMLPDDNIEQIFIKEEVIMEHDVQESMQEISTPFEGVFAHLNFFIPENRQKFT